MRKPLPRESKFGHDGFDFAALMMLAFIILALALPAATALAHASLVRSEPADGARLQQSPPRIAAWFDQELDASTSTIGVFDSQGDAIDGNAGGVDLTDPEHASMTVMLPRTLGPGHYLVRWTAVSAAGSHAGHVTEGEFVFEIGE